MVYNQRNFLLTLRNQEIAQSWFASSGNAMVWTSSHNDQGTIDGGMPEVGVTWVEPLVTPRNSCWHGEMGMWLILVLAVKIVTRWTKSKHLHNVVFTFHQPVMLLLMLFYACRKYSLSATGLLIQYLTLYTRGIFQWAQWVGLQSSLKYNFTVPISRSAWNGHSNWLQQKTHIRFSLLDGPVNIVVSML